MIAVLLMMGGISLVGVVTATLASWIVQRVAQEDSEHEAATAAQMGAVHEDVRLQLEGLRNEIQQLRDVVASRQPPPGTHNGHSVSAVSPIRNWLTGIWLQVTTLRFTEEKGMRYEKGTTS